MVARAYNIQGQYAQSEPLLQQALKLRRAILGSTHLDVAFTLTLLAYLYKRQDQYAQAEPLYREALRIQEKMLSQHDPDVADSNSELGDIYFELDRYDEALKHYQRALSIYDHHKQDDLEVVHILHMLAAIYNIQSQYTQSEPLLERAIKLHKAILGPNHQKVSISLTRLADLYKRQKRYEQALPLYQEALRIREKTIPPNELSLFESLTDLADIYSDQEGQESYAQAETFYQRALALLTQIRAIIDARGIFLHRFCLLLCTARQIQRVRFSLSTCSGCLSGNTGL